MRKYIAFLAVFGLATGAGFLMTKPAAASDGGVSVTITHDRPGLWYYYLPGGKGHWYRTPRLKHRHDFYHRYGWRHFDRHDRFRHRFFDRHDRRDRHHWRRDRHNRGRHWDRDGHRDQHDRDWRRTRDRDRHHR